MSKTIEIGRMSVNMKKERKVTHYFASEKNGYLNITIKITIHDFNFRAPV